MNKEKKCKPLLSVILIWLICLTFRALEYFFLRTDQTILGDAIVHKLLGLLAIYVTAKIFALNEDEIGFKKKGIITSLLKGLLFGVILIIVAYITEIIVLLIHGNACRFNVYLPKYSEKGNLIKQTGIIFFIICILTNLINAIMEEGLFRGIFQKLLEKKYSFIISAIIISILYGLGYIIEPLRSFCDGKTTMENFVAKSIMLVGTTALAGINYAMITKITGNLYMSIGIHFINNTIVSILHVLSKAGITDQTIADKMLVSRICIAQTLSFVVILIWFLIEWNKRKQSKKIKNKYY